MYLYKDGSFRLLKSNKYTDINSVEIKDCN